MTNEIQIFQNEQFGNLRVIDKDTQPWFVASDVSEILGYRSAYDMTRMLEDYEKDTHPVRTPGRSSAGNYNQ